MKESFVIVVELATIKKRLIERRAKKGPIFSLIYFFESLCISYIPNIYVIP